MNYISKDNIILKKEYEIDLEDIRKKENEIDEIVDNNQQNIGSDLVSKISEAKAKQDEYEKEILLNKMKGEDFLESKQNVLDNMQKEIKERYKNIKEFIN